MTTDEAAAGESRHTEAETTPIAIDEDTDDWSETDSESTGLDLIGLARSRAVILAAAAAGVTAAALIGAKIAYDRRKSAKGYMKALDQLEDAKDALIEAASELPERSRAALRRVTRH